MTRNNIVRFPGGSGRSRSTSVEADRLATHEHVAPAGGEPPVPVQPSAGVRAASGVLYGVRYAIFLLLMWMRGPLRFLLGLIVSGAEFPYKFGVDGMLATSSGLISVLNFRHEHAGFTLLPAGLRADGLRSNRRLASGARQCVSGPRPMTLR